MPFVHSLVKSTRSKKKGWCAPVELGEAAPQYVSFVVPVDEEGRFFADYSCEVLTSKGSEKSRSVHRLTLGENNAFRLRLGEALYWFIVKPVAANQRRLPYVGALRHPDFQYLLTEIEPEDQTALDRLCDEAQTFVIGCEPFAHYRGIDEIAKASASKTSPR